MISPKQSMILRSQHQVSEPAVTEFARVIVTERLRNARRLLLRGQRDQKLDLRLNIQQLDFALDELAQRSQSIKSFRGCEGWGFRAYRLGWHQLCKHGIRYKNMKSPSPLLTIVNFLQEKVTNEAIGICAKHGLDPYFGLYHGSSRWGFPGLALDLIHPYTPFLVDALALRLINLRQITAKDFVDWEGKLSARVQGVIVKGVEKKLNSTFAYRLQHIEKGESITYCEALERQAEMLIDHIVSGVPFKAFIIR